MFHLFHHDYRINLIFNNIIDLPALTPLYLNWTGLDDDMTVFSREAV